MLNKAFILLGSQVVNYGCSFARNLILARLLTKADFGVAATCSMAISLLEMSSKLGLGKQIVQSEHGDDANFQKTTQSFLLLSGALSSIILAVSAWPLAIAFGIPNAAVAFAALSIIPLFIGFSNQSASIQQRDYNFTPSVLCESVPQIIVTLATWPMCIWLKDYRAIIALLIVKAFLSFITTHLVSKHTFRIGWHREFVFQIWNFSWPLILNNFVLFAAQKADQALVGSLLSLETLAGYSIAFTLANIPWFIYAQTLSPIMLAQLSKAQDKRLSFIHKYKQFTQLAASAALLAICPMMLLGEHLITLIYGAKYAGTGSILSVFAVATSLRFLRLSPTIAATARADTINNLNNNLARSISLPLAAAGLIYGLGPISAAACAIVGELASIVYSSFRLRSKQNIPLHCTLLPSALVLSVGIITTATSAIPLVLESTPIALLSTAVSTAISIGLIKLFLNDSYSLIKQSILSYAKLR